ncbi:MAG: hypothetical protein JRI23_20715 [Deltaproteobacteria bacterium]|nr:hypothetical protein [Deltaproteobacteria bacterium]MBW2534327.1 hypothetical protein [Deltaproteobacteria bacterium]
MRRTRWYGPAGLAALPLLVATCGGTAVVDAPAADGPGGSTTTATNTSTPTKTPPCTSHDDCPDGVCLFVTGQCVDSCTAQSCDSCGPGQFCEPCGTSSCPDCRDCVAACLPAGPARCDEDDPCPGGDLCHWSFGTCLPPCEADGDCGSFAYCDPCATSSGCSLKDCVAACMGGE